MRFSLRLVWVVVASIAVILSAGSFLERNLLSMNSQIGLGCMYAIPFSPFVLGFLGFATHKLTGVTRFQVTALGAILGATCSIFSIFLLRYIVFEYWVS